jgi:hypothetical protein
MQMAGRKQTVANPLAGLAALAQLGEVISALNGGTTTEPKKREFKGAREGMRAVAVISVKEIEALASAVKTGKEVEVTDDNGRRTVIEVLSDEDAAKFRGKFRIHRALAPKA